MNKNKSKEKITPNKSNNEGSKTGLENPVQTPLLSTSQNPNQNIEVNVQQADPDVSELETHLLATGKISSFTLLPSDIVKIQRQTRMKEEIVKFLQELYKPRSQFEQERVEYNHINILSEFILYNIIFAKNDLQFDEFKIAALCDIFWKLLEFNPEDPAAVDEERADERKANDVGSNSGDMRSVPNSGKKNSLNDESMRRWNGQNEGASGNIEFRGDDIEVEREFESCLKHKMALFQQLIVGQLKEENEALKFNLEDAKRISRYAQETYFRHLRLYEFVFNNTTASEIKRINFVQEEAKKASPLQQALQISKGRQERTEQQSDSNSPMQSERAESRPNLADELQEMDQSQMEMEADAQPPEMNAEPSQMEHATSMDTDVKETGMTEEQKKAF